VEVIAQRVAEGVEALRAIAVVAFEADRNAETNLQSALEFETFAQNACRDTEDAREGMRAFVEKRAPAFRGR
jgi:enoyl-CoA hydratase/carnithine racemase